MKQIIGAIALLCLWLGQASANADYWRREWPKTEFFQHSVPLSDILSGGPSRNGIPTIDHPSFKPVSEIERLAATEPVIELAING
ncbi:MAG: hypothetical protein VYB59_09970, partial [Pseudomonadota bacterium]|nr:hypothetical protein [Pseudomonadota bacterium]